MAQPFELGQLANLISVDDSNQSLAISTSVTVSVDATVSNDLTVSSNLSVTGTSDLDRINCGIISATSVGIGSTFSTNDYGIEVVGILTATTFSGSGSLLTNIPNSSLDNTSVSYGGVQLSLGESDSTPAFDLTDATDLPVSTGISGLGANVSTFLATPSSSNLTSAVTDGGTGSGSLVLSGSPSLTSPNIGEAEAISVNATGIVTASQLVSSSGVTLDGLLKENVNIVSGKVSDYYEINVEDGMVHLFTDEETTTFTPNFRYSASETLDSKMSVGENISVSIIYPADAVGYGATVTIDGSNKGINWLGGSIPEAGGESGYDYYSYNIIKTASSTFVVLANVVNFVW